MTRAAIIVTGALAALLAFGPAAASAEPLSPWFSVASLDRPGNLQPGAGKDEVQRLTVSATQGNAFVAEPTRLNEVLEGQRPLSELLYAVFPFDATRQTVQEALEKVYPMRRVLVAEGEGDTNDTHSWVITFPGQAVPPMFASGVFAVIAGAAPLSCEEGLSECTSEATASQLAEGKPGDEILVRAYNVGDATANLALGNGGIPLQIAEALPPGLTATFIEAHVEGHYNYERLPWKYIPMASRCELSNLTCELTEGTIPPFIKKVEVSIGVQIEPGASSGETNVTTISGGGSARAVRSSHAITVAKTPGEATPFGVEGFQMNNEEATGRADAQAGSHPFQTTFTLNLKEAIEENEGTPAQMVKDIDIKLPPGWIANPSAYPHCTLEQFYRIEGTIDACPDDTVIGVAALQLKGGVTASEGHAYSPIFNLETSVGEPARFGFFPGGVPVLIGASVRTGGDYGITAHVKNVTQLVGFLSQTVTFWGVPDAVSHDGLRGWGCLERVEVEDGLRPSQANPCEVPPAKPPPFLTMPTTCGTEVESTVEGDSWQEANERKLHGLPEQERSLATDQMGTLDGCGDLLFGPEVRITPDSEATSTPSGLNVDVHVPQEGALNGAGLAAADVKSISVSLPEGVALNPAAGDGLESCPLLTGHGQEAAEAKDEVVGINFETPQEANCPNASKIATATIKTPLLPGGEYLRGFAYLASQQNFGGPLENPFQSLIAMYFAVRDPISGVLVKLAGQVSLSPTGQVTTTFAHTPPLPFEDAEIHFFGGERAPLATPARCGAYTTTSSFEPWTSTERFPRTASADSTFNMSSGPSGSPCPGPSLPFSPYLTSGTTSNQAGGFSPFTMTMSREDGNQNLSSIELHMPPGLSGTLANVKLCPEPQADEGTCPEDSLIGETIVSVGLGGDPFSVKGGKVYLTGPYRGASFGLSIVNPAKAGPFDLEDTPNQHPACDCLVVRATVEVNPLTAALTIRTNPPGTAYSVPTIIEGIPLEIKHLNVTINHLEDFTFNPTNCNKMAITGTLFSTEGAADQLSVPFQVTNCAALGFKPQFAVSTEGKTSRTDGASLTATLSYPNVGGHSVLATGLANISRVKVELPKKMPSRLSTLQKACTSKTFYANPAACPPASKIGFATATTPLLPEQLKGPAYFVSNGSAKFPELIVVLQGYGVTVDLHGETFIDKEGITSSTFATVPDVPVGTFQLTLPEGPDSALAANGQLCGSKLTMPTEFAAQNGDVIRESTPITVTGCKKMIAVKHHKTKGRKTSITVSVPSAGTLTASATGVSTATVRAVRAGAVTVDLALTRHERAVLARHEGRRLAAHIDLVFVSRDGGRMTSSAVVIIG